MTVALKPRLRGVFHEYSFFISVVSGVVLVLASSADAARVASAVYSASLAGLFGVSALYHRVAWQPRARRWMRRLDHSMIYLLIAGTYTPMTLLVMSPQTGALALRLVWSAALAGIVLNLAWITAPRWVSVTIYGLLAWAGAGIVPELSARVAAPTVLLLVSGGVVYSLGALAYVTRRPNPAPATFGYHEVFHALTIAAAGLHFAAVTSVVLTAA
jgi:hemolysin III